MNRYYSGTLGRFLSPDPYRASGGPASPQSWNRYAYVLNDPVNFHDGTGLDLEGDQPDDGIIYDSGAVFNVVVSANSAGGLPLDAPAGYGGNVSSSNSTNWPNGTYSTSLVAVGQELYMIDARTLSQLASQFAETLLSGSVPSPCDQDMLKMGIEPEQWADALNNADILNGIGSGFSLAATQLNGSPEQQRAQGMSVGSSFGPKSGTVALSNINGNQVWINPFLVNPADALGDSALMAHEVIHNLGLTDRMIQTDLGLSTTAPSSNITTKLQTDCFPAAGPSGLLP